MLVGKNRDILLYHNVWQTNLHSSVLMEKEAIAIFFFPKNNFSFSVSRFLHDSVSLKRYHFWLFMIGHMGWSPNKF